MRILLVGEYSRLHNSLKEGLTALGHEAVIVGTGDGFKQYSTDFSIASKTMGGSALARIINRAVYKLTGIHLELTEKGLRFYRLLPQLKGFDYVQLINSDAIETHPWLAKLLYKKLLKQNGPMSLLVCGDDTPIIDFCLTGKLKYSILTPYLKDRGLKRYYAYTLKYIESNYRSLFEWVKAHASGIITSDLDYEVPMKAMGYTTTLIPNPINSNTIAPVTPSTGKIVIFLGINRLSHIKKGIAFFEEALAIIGKKYPDTVEIVITENIPYSDYIQLYNSAHIVLDQVYAYDQGYNALEAMAKGKVVFTGAETEFTQHYNLTQKVAINALPDVNALVAELRYLIENPSEINAISNRARAFIEQEHNYIAVAKKYLEVWGNKKPTQLRGL
jgi:glycosyltransferase involved in cell wall biosynthesis